MRACLSLCVRARTRVRVRACERLQARLCDTRVHVRSSLRALQRQLTSGVRHFQQFLQNGL